MITETLERPTLTGANLFDNTIGLRLELRKLGIARKLSPSDVEADADRDLLRVGKDILESDAYTAIVRRDNEIRAWVKKRASSCPLFAGGAYLVKLANYPIIAAELRRYQDEERPALVDAFMADYDRAAADGLARLRALGSDRDYPPAWKARAAFAVDVAWFGMGAPGALRTISDETFKAEAAKVGREFQRALDAGRAVMRAEWADLVARMVDRLEPGADGKRKRFTETLTANVREFIDLFQGRDLTGDQQLAALLETADRALAGVDVSQLRDDDTLRERTAAAFQAIKADVDTMIRAEGRAYGEDY